MKAKRRSLVTILIICITILLEFPLNISLETTGYDEVKGDFNGDGIVSVADVVFLMRYITEDDLLLLEQNVVCADLDNDGLVTILDVQTLLRYYVPQTAVTEPPFSDNEGTTTETTTIETDYLQNLRTLLPYQQSPFVTLNQNQPYFSITNDTTAFEYYSPLDTLGRCGYCEACVGQELMPTEPRGSIGMVKPSGWQLVRYDGIVEGNYLYNRCHLIGYQLTGENANECNLITGTRYLNVTGMLPFENQTASYINSTGNHVRYRVTPYFEQNNLVASGVLMEAASVEDHGQGLQFNVFCYNVQPFIFIDYATGDSHLIDAEMNPETDEPQPDVDYVINKSTKKFHYPYCSSVADIKEENKIEYSGNREELIAQGYIPCKRCNP